MRRQQSLGVLSVVLFSSLTTLSCSRPMTCALEGCKQDNGVVLADDLQSGQSADATAKKDDLAQKIKDIANRLGASEALSALLQETVRLHDTRIRLLEDHAKAVDGRLSSIDGMIDHHEEEIHAQAQALRVLETSLNARLESQAAEEKIALDSLRLDLETTESTLKNSIKSLDDATQSAINTILQDMKMERAHRESADLAVADAAQIKLNGLQTLLEGRILLLEGEDKAIHLAHTTEIARLDGRVDGVIKSSNKEFAKLWSSLGLLQAQIILVAVDNVLEHQRIRREIDDVKKLLKAEVVKLTAADQATAKDILDLYDKQGKTQAQLDKLEKNYNDFVLEQTETNKTINKNYTDLTGSVSLLKSTLDSHISTEAARVQDIVNALLPAVTSRVTALETKTNGLQTSLDQLEDKVDSIEDDFDSLNDKHKDLRKDYDDFVRDTNKELKDLSDALEGIQSCSLKVNPAKVELTCGSQTVSLKIQN